VNEDILIKSVMFGGFNKEEVLKYIEKIQSEHLAQIEEMKHKQYETEQALLQVKELELQLEAEKKRFSALTKLNDEYCEKIYALEEQKKELNNKFESMQEDCGRMKSVETQIGSLLLNAALYSDKITQKAKQTANNVTENARQNIVSANEDVCRLGLDISQTASVFSKDISTISEKIKDLSETLSSLEKRLGIENETDEKEDASQETFSEFFNSGKSDVNIAGNTTEKSSFVKKQDSNEEESAYYSESTGYSPSTPEPDEYTDTVDSGKQNSDGEN